MLKVVVHKICRGSGKEYVRVEFHEEYVLCWFWSRKRGGEEQCPPFVYSFEKPVCASWCTWLAIRFCGGCYRVRAWVPEFGLRGQTQVLMVSTSRVRIPPHARFIFVVSWCLGWCCLTAGVSSRLLFSDGLACCFFFVCVFSVVAVQVVYFRPVSALQI